MGPLAFWQRFVTTFAPMSNGTGKITARNERGQTREFSVRSWDLMKNAKDGDSDTRKGWTRIEPSARTTTVRPVLPSKKGAIPFVPPEIEEAERLKGKAEAERVAGMISGEKVPAAAPAPTEEVKPAEAAPVAQQQPADVLPAQQQPAAEVTPDDLAAIPGIGAKVAAALNAAGINTYAKLVSATPGIINDALDSINMGAKKAQVPSWKMKAKELMPSKKA